MMKYKSFIYQLCHIPFYLSDVYESVHQSSIMNFCLQPFSFIHTHLFIYCLPVCLLLVISSIYICTYKPNITYMYCSIHSIFIIVDDESTMCLSSIYPSSIGLSYPSLFPSLFCLYHLLIYLSLFIYHIDFIFLCIAIICVCVCVSSMFSLCVYFCIIYIYLWWV